MSGIYETVIKNTKKIESLIEEKLNAEGKGLYEKTVSVEEYIEQEIVRKIRRIATIRNKLMHEDNFELADMVSFEDDCKEVIYYLSTTEFDLSDIPRSVESDQSRNSRVCKSCGAETKPILRIINGGWFTREKIRHICAICGEDMYITGGGRTWLASFIFWYFVIGIIGSMIFSIGFSIINDGIFLGTAEVLVLLAGFYWWWKRKKGKG